MIRKSGFFLAVIFIAFFTFQSGAKAESGSDEYHRGNYYYGLKDYKKAIMWYSRASKKKYAPAIYKMGLMYGSGKGSTLNYRTAAKHYEKSAKLGYHPAQYQLGLMYAKGIGVKKNDVKAYVWYVKAQESGNKIVGRHLKKLEKNMDKRDIVKALKILKKFKKKK
ncbi:MAG: sel1 repeat family protein [Magnetococcales bacterium]|nr:sel1 repeat family protein [Magnetococcales bacterium]